MTAVGRTSRPRTTDEDKHRGQRPHIRLTVDLLRASAEVRVGRTTIARTMAADHTAARRPRLRWIGVHVQRLRTVVVDTAAPLQHPLMTEVRWVARCRPMGAEDSVEAAHRRTAGAEGMRRPTGEAVGGGHGL